MKKRLPGVIFAVSAVTLSLLSPRLEGSMIPASRDSPFAARASRLAASASNPAVDALFSAWNVKDSPGCALGVFQNGAMAYARGYGSASLEHEVPITPDSVFYAGSVSKQFTAMAAALAVQQGKLTYDDPIRKYLPELPVYADAIRVSHLLHHTSGLRDYNTLLNIAGRRDEDAWDNRAVLRITARQTALNFTPGDEYLYSNTGYTLLATIVARATGTPFAEFAERHIFKPLGMTASHFHTDARRLVPRRALGYGGRSGAWTLDTPINERAGAGGLYTNVPDLLKWDENFYSGKVGGAELLKTLQTRGTLNNGTTLAYGWGLQIGSYRGLPIVEHSGSLGGYRAHLLRIPSAHTSVALLCNAGSIGATGLARDVAGVILKDRFTEPPAPVQGGVAGTAASTPWFPTESEMRGLVGTYYGAELEATFTLSLRQTAPSGFELLLQRDDGEPQVLRPGSTPSGNGPGAGEFQAGALRIRFDRDGAGSVTGLLVDAGRVRGIRFVRR